MNHTTTAILTPTDLPVLVALKKAYDDDEGKSADRWRGFRYATELGADWQQLDAMTAFVRADIQPGRPLSGAGNRRYRITEQGMAALADYQKSQPVITESQPMTSTTPTYRSLADFLAILERPFALDEHGFVNGNPYIRKNAIRHRLTEVDPSWTISEPEIMAMTDEVVVMRGTLTVNGVTRAAVGSATILRHQRIEHKDQPDEYIPLNPVEQTRQVSKACKAAASDIIARAALEFGIGVYLKEIPKGKNDPKINNFDALERYLKTLTPTPKHWALNGGGEKFNARRAELGITQGAVFKHFRISRLGEINLSFEDAMAQLETLADQPKATPPAADPPMISIPANKVQEGDVVAHVDGCKTITFAIPVDDKKTRVRYTQNGVEKEGEMSSIYNVKIISGPSFDAAPAKA